MRTVLIAVLVVATGCASAQDAQIEIKPGELSSPKDVGEPLKLTTERNGKRTRDGFIFVDVTLENAGPDFLTVDAHDLAPVAGMPALRMVAGKELAAWIEDAANRELAARTHRRWAFTALTVAGALVGVGGAIGRSTTAQVVGGAAVLGGVAGSVANDVGAESDAINRANMYPSDHLFAGEVTIAPKARVKRWFLLQLESEQVAKAPLTVGVEVDVTAREAKRDRRYLMAF